MGAEAEAFLLGIWKNFDEMESELTMEELEHILEASRKKDMTNWRFQASLKGIDLDEDRDDETGMTVDSKIREMEARSRGVDRDTFEFNEIGIEVISE